jgi:hemolysin III
VPQRLSGEPAAAAGPRQVCRARETQLAEEVVNSLTHGVGFVLSVLGIALLLGFALVRGSPVHVLACGVYGATLVGLYAASALYHGCRTPSRKQLLRVIDHCAIYLLIAGTYTPFTLVSLRGNGGAALFALVWALAVLGIIYKAFLFGRFPRLALALYLGMGWLGLLAVRPILELLPGQGIALLLGGGLLYTAGVGFYLRDHLPYRHAIWHLFVLAGSACHYFAVLTVVVPAAG